MCTLGEEKNPQELFAKERRVLQPACFMQIPCIFYIIDSTFTNYEAEGRRTSYSSSIMVSKILAQIFKDYNPHHHKIHKAAFS